ncbi:MAG: site-2 protease family protein [Candidatus Nanohaloarchaeota archaeon]|nr:site-2 protease family protein [Candidatus Nanohaloarchaeota archaeon]
MNYDWIIFLIFIAVVAVIERKNFKREGIAFLRRTDKGIEVLKNFAKKHHKVINLLADFAIVLSIGFLAIKDVKNKRQYVAYVLAFYLFFVQLDMIYQGLNSMFQGITIPYFLIIFSFVMSFLFGVSGYGLSLLISGSVAILLSKLTQHTIANSPLQLVLPISLPESYNLPIFTVPFDKWIISLAVIVVVHELAHAVVALANGIKVKSLGYGLFAIMPVGFAEPDEKQLQKAPRLKKLRVYAAGSFANFLTATLFGVLLFLMMHASSWLNIYSFEGISYSYVFNTSHAYGIIPQNGTITAIDNQTLHNFSQFINYLSSKHPNDTIFLTIDNKTYEVMLTSSPENSSQAFIGIGGVMPLYSLKSMWFYPLVYLADLFKWIFILNLGIGIANLLPLVPFDGGLMVKEYIRKKKMQKIFFGMVLFLLLFSLFGRYVI